MSAKDRAAVINKLFKYCKKEYQVITPPSERSVLDHMLYACLLQDSTFDAADEAFAKLENSYFDWNEVRVTTTVELAEHFKNLKIAPEAANRIRKTLHGVFEAFYSFEIDYLKKENLGKAVTQLSKFKGMSPFVVSYTSQNALGGHSIPIDRAMLLLFSTLGIASEADIKKFKVTGLERVIPKSKGVEFFILVHQFAVKYLAKPFSKDTRAELIKLVPDAKDRFPKRASKKKVAPKAEPKPVETEKKSAKKTAGKKPAAKATKKKVPTKRAPAKKAPVKKAVKKKAAKKTAVKKSPKKKTAKKATRKTTAKKAKKTTKKKPSTTKRLKKKKPR